jgi:hypothetical protein
LFKRIQEPGRRSPGRSGKASQRQGDLLRVAGKSNSAQPAPDASATGCSPAESVTRMPCAVIRRHRDQSGVAIQGEAAAIAADKSFNPLHRTRARK